MALPTMTTNVANHAAVVEDYPQDNGANPLTPAELRTLLDKGAVDIKSFLNDILIPAILAANIPFVAGGGISSTNIEAAVKETYAAIAEAVAGDIVDGSITFSKLADTALASQSDALAATATNKIISPLRVKEYVTSILATLAEAQAGSSETKLVTPKRVADYLAYIQATQAEAQAGVNTTHWTTPQRVAQYVTAILATQAEAQAGTNTTHLMNPLRVSQAITALGAKVASGSYVGTATEPNETQNIVIGFQPDIVIVIQSFTTTPNLDLGHYSIGRYVPAVIVGNSTITGSNTPFATVFARTSTGFTVGISSWDGTAYYPALNTVGTTYYYFAIKAGA